MKPLRNVVIIALMTFICIITSATDSIAGKIVSFHWPTLTLRGNERIISASVSFEVARIKSIKNIPKGWYIELDKNIPPNPIFRCSIIVGVAALFSVTKLPLLEIEGEIEGEKPKAVKVEYVVTDFTSKKEEERKIEIDLNKH